METNETQVEAKFLSDFEVEDLASTNNSRRVQADFESHLVKVYVASQNARSIIFQLNFTLPDQISRTKIKDSAKVKILLPSALKSATNLKPLKMDPSADQTLSAEIPPQISTAVQNVMQNIASTLKVIVETTASSNFIVSLLLQGSMQQLFGMIRAM